MRSMSPEEVFRFYVYTLSYPESMGGAVFYIGKGTRGRITSHVSEAKRGVESPKCEVIRSILAQGEQIVYAKVQDNMTDSRALALESRLIHQHGYANLTNRPLERARKETIFPRTITVPSFLRKEVEDGIRARMEEEGIALTRWNCSVYIQNVLVESLTAHAKLAERNG